MAKKDDRSISYIVNQAIKEFIKENTPDRKMGEYKKRAFFSCALLPDMLYYRQKKGKAIETATLSN